MNGEQRRMRVSFRPTTLDETKKSKSRDELLRKRPDAVGEIGFYVVGGSVGDVSSFGQWSFCPAMQLEKLLEKGVTEFANSIRPGT